MAGLLSLKYGTETNWKAGDTQLREELKIAHTANRALSDTASIASSQLAAAKGELEVKKQDLALQQATWSVREAELQKALSLDPRDGAAREWHGGSGYWSQDSVVQVFGGSPDRLSIRWPGGKTATVTVPPGAREVSVDAAGAIKAVR